VAKEPAHRGEHEVSRKTIAQGMSECFRCPVGSCAPNAQFLAHETAGAARTRHSLRPLFSRRDNEFGNNSGKTCRENADAHSIVIVREGGRSSIPEAAVIEPRGLGVLDTPPSRGMTAGCCLKIESEAALSSFSPCGRRRREAPDEGSASAETDPSPVSIALARLIHPLPQGEREEATTLTPRARQNPPSPHSRARSLHGPRSSKSCRCP
jgi:hypothetical protein